MELQSGYSLPIIYQAFDTEKRWHWGDRGYLFDFLYSTEAEGKKVLDFGPGDGWPSLLVAPYVKEVIGLDSSLKRVEICRENAEKMGITNASFKSYIAGEKLPFADNSFDAIMAASSIEQTPDPFKTLKELHRVLKPGGRLRFRYESLNLYKEGKEKDIWVASLGNKSRIILFDRKIEEEYVDQYGISIALSKEDLLKRLGLKNISYDSITIEKIKSLDSKITGSIKCKTIHPSGRTYYRYLKEIGFKEIFPTHSGAYAADQLYDFYEQSETEKFSKIEGVKYVDELIKPVVKIAINLDAPIEIDPTITAIK
ncbi:class I SAM-dependent methyltransferase [Natronospora cellulosivora (SeqCode)]